MTVSIHQSNGEPKLSSMQKRSERLAGKGSRDVADMTLPGIFEHHLSVVEGHLNMVETIRKNTAEGTANWNTVSTMHKRCVEMLDQTRKLNRESVSSDDISSKISIESGSNPTHLSHTPPGQPILENGVHPSRAQRDARMALRQNAPRYEASSNYARRTSALPNNPPMPKRNPKGTAANAVPLGQIRSFKASEDSGNPSHYFVIDSNPTPLDDSVALAGSAKPAKNGKLTGTSTTATSAATDSKNISKEEKRAKKDKKRKREPEEAMANTVAASESTDPTKVDDDKPPKSKKPRKPKDNTSLDLSIREKRALKKKEKKTRDQKKIKNKKDKKRKKKTKD